MNAINFDIINFSQGCTDRQTDGQLEGRIDGRKNDGYMLLYSIIVKLSEIDTEIACFWSFLDSGTLDSGFSPFPPLPPRWIKNGLSQKRFKIERWGLWQSTRNWRFYIPVFNILCVKM